MRHYLSVVRGVASRNLLAAFKTPALLLPPLIAPLVFFAVFAGGLSAMGRTPGFDFPSGYTAFQFVFVLLQAAVFNGVFAGFVVAQDFDSGFVRRLMLGAPRRSAVLLGYALSGLTRTAMVMALLFVAGIVFGMQIDGDLLHVGGLVLIAFGAGTAGSLWATGIAMRVRTIQGAPLMQIPMFLSLFLAPVFVPLALMTGWIHDVASVNPITFFLEAGRGYISGRPTRVNDAFVALAVIVPALVAWSLMGLRRAERSV